MQCVICHHFKLSILQMHFSCCRFCLVYTKQKSDGHCLRRKQQHDTIHSSRNLKTAFCTAWHSCQMHLRTYSY